MIAVIAILAALLLPALSQAKASALRVRCASNLHQIGLALRLYVDEFQKYPTFNNRLPAIARPEFWDSKLLGYAGGNQGLFLCPANTTRNTSVSNNWYFWDRSGQLCPNRSYGYKVFGSAINPRYGLGGASVDPWPTPLRETLVVAAADMIAVADYDPLATDDDGDGDLHPDMLWSGLTGRHNRRANVVFCEAHVECSKTNQWKAHNNPANRRWNNDHQPHW